MGIGNISTVVQSVVGRHWDGPYAADEVRGYVEDAKSAKAAKATKAANEAAAAQAALSQEVRDAYDKLERLLQATRHKQYPDLLRQLGLPVVVDRKLESLQQTSSMTHGPGLYLYR